MQSQNWRQNTARIWIPAGGQPIDVQRRLSFLLLLSMVEMACGMERHGCLCTRGEDRTQPGYGSLRVSQPIDVKCQLSIYFFSLWWRWHAVNTWPRQHVCTRGEDRAQPGYGSLCVCVCVCGQLENPLRWYCLHGWKRRRRRLIEGNAKSLRLKSDLEKKRLCGRCLSVWAPFPS